MTLRHSRTLRAIASAGSVAALLIIAGCGSDDTDAGTEDETETGVATDEDTEDETDDDADAVELDLVAAGSLTVCTDSPYPPFEFEDPDAPSGYSGFDIDIVQAIADELSLELVVQNVSFEALQSGTALAAGQCDVGASAITITPEREENLTFSAPYYDSLQSLLVAADSGIDSLADLEDAQIGVQAGTTGRAYAQENAPESATLVDYPGNAELMAALRAGQIAAILQDQPVNVDNARADADYVIAEEYATDEQYGFAFAGDADEALVAAFDEALQALRDDGTYEEIYDSYFAVDAD